MAEYHDVAVKILTPGALSKWQAERYGFLALDLVGTAAATWSRLALIVKAERWKPRDVRLVSRHSAATIELRSGEESEIIQVVPERMTELSRAA